MEASNRLRLMFALSVLCRSLSAAAVSFRGSESSVNAKATSNSTKQDEDQDIIQRDGIEPCTDRPLLFIAVPSGPLSAERRLTVRNTWLQYKVVTDMNCVEHKFFVGGHQIGGSAKTLIEWENDKYKDVVYLPLKDDYDALTNKTLTIMQWYAANSRAEWLMKIDDDSFPHLENVMRYLQGYGMPRYAYTGSFLWDHPVLHDGKWAEREGYEGMSLEGRQGKFYPPYAVGAGYMLTRKLVRRFVRDVYYNSTGRRDLLRNEDCTVGYWIDRMQDKHLVQLKDVKASMWGCQTGDLLSMQLPIQVMKCMWRFKSSRFPVHDDHICCN